MASGPQQFSRAAEFWDRHTQSSHLIDEKSLATLEGAVNAVEGRSTLGLEHIQAFTLAISVCEAQIRDCIRLAVDSPFVPIDGESFLLKNVRPDYALLNSIRDRHVSLGEFLSFNVSISTVERFISGVTFGFPQHGDLALSYDNWDIAKTLNPQVPFENLKSSLAFVFEQRNRFIHEFSELIAAEVGKVHDNERMVAPLRHVLLLLRFVQWLKVGYYGREYNEMHPSRGHLGKELNALSATIKSELDELDALLRASRAAPEWHLPPTAETRKAIAAFRAAHSDYLYRLADFYAYVHGPGTIVNDFIYGAHLEHLQQFEKHLAWALDQSRLLHDPSDSVSGN